MAKGKKEGTVVFLLFLLVELVIIELVIIKGVDDLASEWELWVTAGGFLFIYILYLKFRTQEVAKHVVDEKVKTHVLIDALPVGVVVLDEENTVVALNQKASVALAIDPVQGMGGKFDALVAGEIGEKTRQGYSGRIGPVNGRIVDFLPLSQGKGRLVLVGEEPREKRTASTGWGDLQKTSVDVGRVADDAVARQAAVAAGKKLTVTVEKKGENLIIAADEALLRRALAEIVENACRYAHDGGKVTVGVQGGSDGVDIAIRDEGAGIREGDIARVFDRGFVGVAVPALGGRGSGLGLYLAKGMIEAHGGTVWAESREGMGTRISINLPR